MATTVYTDEETGSTIEETEGGTFVIEDGDGEPIADIGPDGAEQIVDVCEMLLDPDTNVNGKKGPSGDGWELGQVSNMFGIPTGFGFKRLSDEELAVFYGELDLCETFVQIFGE